MNRVQLRIFRASELQVSKESNIESGWWSDSNEVIVNTKSLFVKWYTGNRAQSVSCLGANFVDKPTLKSF
jgi:hypothetical protein